MAVKYNLTIDKGATFQQNFVYQDSTGAIVDMSGFTARMMIKDSFGGATIVELTTENDGITITTGTGEIDLLITATATALYSPVTAVYDLELVNGTEVTRLIEGKVFITENVTV